ncbi:hypothetical protein GJ744_002465 [Endocarpon pusillum]|uniref:Uncharacterized protein n=1 Tax=Endocarpon pusillum TaxID=364733 RepID=A0A8H7A7Z7_9EURO|nr:hypothetical protein GJ744_002465 [Endocarpon pusillum]
MGASRKELVYDGVIQRDESQRIMRIAVVLPLRSFDPVLLSHAAFHQPLRILDLAGGLLLHGMLIRADPHIPEYLSNDELDSGTPGIAKASLVTEIGKERGSKSGLFRAIQSRAQA